jgi:hypothetical protein
MAVRTPLYFVSGNLREMDSAMIDEIKALAIYEYSLNPSRTLAVVGSGGNLTSITDTRLQAGAASTSVSAFPNEATTAEPSVVTVSYERITQSAASIIATADTGKTFPLYYTSSGNLRAMDATDFLDTFIHPAITTLALDTTTPSQGGTYFVSTSASVVGATLVSATPIFLDTRADTSLYTADGIGETLDQPTTIQSYYLHRVNGSIVTLTQVPLYADASNNIKQFSQAEIASLLSNYISFEAVSSTLGHSLSYNLGTSGSGNIRGSGMTDTRLNGTGNYQTRFVNADDYRAQEFPNGTAVSINTYYLRINKS